MVKDALKVSPLSTLSALVLALVLVYRIQYFAKESDFVFELVLL